MSFKYQHIIGFYQGWQEGFCILGHKKNRKLKHYCIDFMRHWFARQKKGILLPGNFFSSFLQPWFPSLQWPWCRWLLPSPWPCLQYAPERNALWWSCKGGWSENSGERVRSGCVCRQGRKVETILADHCKDNIRVRSPSAPVKAWRKCQDRPIAATDYALRALFFEPGAGRL